MSDLVKQLEQLVEIPRTEPFVACVKCGTKHRLASHVDDRLVSASLLKEVLDVVRKEASGELVPVAAPAAYAGNVLEFSAPGPVGLTPVQRAEALAAFECTEKLAIAVRYLRLISGDPKDDEHGRGATPLTWGQINAREALDELGLPYVEPFSDEEE